MDYFPARNMETELIQQRVDKYWDLSAPVPYPKVQFSCPVCGESEIHLRYWKYHVRNTKSSRPYRCDVTFKCTHCSYVWWHGLLISEDYWKKRPGQSVSWRNGYNILKESGVL